MLKTSALILLALVLAVAGGGASAWYALQAPEGVGAVTIGGWTAFPNVGTPEIDPYSRARIAREGVLALGRAEGLAFVAQRDSSGDTLRRECRYTVEGPVPPARFWTLYAADRALLPLPSPTPRQPAIHSYEVLHPAREVLILSVGAHPAQGNWLATSGAGAMSLVLTLYDAPAAGGTDLSGVQLPQIIKSGCDA